jgi:hypothetical protein
MEWAIVLRLAAGSLPAAAGLLAVITFLPINTVALAHWIRMGLVAALPISGLAIVIYPLSPAPRRTRIPATCRARAADGTVRCGARLLVTLTSVGAGAIGVTVLAMLYPCCRRSGWSALTWRTLCR